ncbi:hypothetical protein Phum_PHUM433180 [Pediculus humanus corporis]|uniref:Uncharacterized protein n=1 Tax=Pediculus humanus subsp. corporis TaxID=121224 RepID=E0VTM5_PEDHC|nr:uncharacterized protein Phum_PHUM433180 [Pediculus humanus corporis]EEB16700.1 hypothetical protein Phum_PHUM433180 [Pediculus humanus corporis]
MGKNEKKKKNFFYLLTLLLLLLLLLPPIRNQKVVGIQQYLVRPNVANTSDSFLSSEILVETSITEELVRKSLSLEYVILQVVGIQQYLVRPNVANTSDSFLSSEILVETSITEELVRKSLSLEYVILQILKRGKKEKRRMNGIIDWPIRLLDSQ